MLLAVYATTIFVTAALLFLVQPMFARMVLPLLGGSPAVWNTCLVFYQAALLAGYLYAHATTSWLGARRQAALHVGLVLVPLLSLPIAIPSDWTPPATDNPIPWLLALLGVTVGLPFFVVSTSSPLLQRWFAGTGHPGPGWAPGSRAGRAPSAWGSARSRSPARSTPASRDGRSPPAGASSA